MPGSNRRGDVVPCSCGWKPKDRRCIASLACMRCGCRLVHPKDVAAVPLVMTYATGLRVRHHTHNFVCLRCKVEYLRKYAKEALRWGITKEGF